MNGGALVGAGSLWLSGAIEECMLKESFDYCAQMNSRRGEHDGRSRLFHARSLKLLVERSPK